MARRKRNVRPVIGREHGWSPDAQQAVRDARAGRCRSAFRHLMVQRIEDGKMGKKYDKHYTAAALIYDKLCGRGEKVAKYSDIASLGGVKKRRRRRK